jgi:acetyltransferase-like isoleucine patch superfamily enzyme
MVFKSIVNRVLSGRRDTIVSVELDEMESFFLLFDKFLQWMRGMIYIGAAPDKLLFLSKGVTIKSRARFQFGSKCQIYDNAYIDCLGSMGVTLGDNVTIGAYSRLVVSSDITNLGSFIKFGDNVGIGEFSRVGGSGGVSIGNDTIIGQYFSCHPENHIFSDNSIPIRLQGTSRKPIVIGEGCWLGSKVTLLAGTVIGRNSVVAAGSVVKGEFPSGVIIGGVPAKVLRTII